MLVVGDRPALHGCSAVKSNPSYPPVIYRDILALDCFQPLGIKDYTLGRQASFRVTQRCEAFRTFRAVNPFKEGGAS
jgi:hypothetical protein